MPPKPGRMPRIPGGAKQPGKISGRKSPLNPPSSRHAPAQQQQQQRKQPPSQSPRDNPPMTPPTKPKSNTPKLLTLSAVAVFAFSTYGSYLYVTYKKAVEDSRALDVPVDVSDRYDRTARTYDAEVDAAETVMRLGKRRKELVQRARGNVLEVSCGTGRNMEYYVLGERRGVDRDGRAEVQGCRTVTFVDQSGEMVEIAREKFGRLYPEFMPKATFWAQDAGMVEGVPTSKSSSSGEEEGRGLQKFDTLIQTMGVCSHPDPAALLKHLGEITKTEGGQILLLEHGRSHYKWLNNLLDNLAPAHADRHGCWWNRDIGEIVRGSGLEVVEAERWHLGTTWQFILRPRTIQPEEVVDGKDMKSASGVKRASWISWASTKEIWYLCIILIPLL